ncbi:MAG: hypothetical protein K6E85_16630 [Lachnospiraceae bacterium]|nr:hypothetical protein [Lachnospiraceae bacterium]
MPKKTRFHYCVLFTQVAKQARLTEVLKEALPKERGTVFYPCMEYYRRDCGQNAIKPIFPGYIFVRSDMNAAELHEFIKKNRDKAGTYVRELGLRAQMEGLGTDKESGSFIEGGSRGVSGSLVESGSGAEGKESTGGEDRHKNYILEKQDDYGLKDLTEDESRFMDFLLGIVVDDDNDDLDDEFDDFVEFEEYEDEEPSSSTGFSDGLLRMSYGYQENGKYIVMEGPLKVYQDKIIDVNKHDRKAFLDFEVNGYQVRAGFEVKPKKYWFPEE